MKKLKLDISKVDLKLMPDDEKKSEIELCADVIKNVILTCGAQSQNRGLAEEDRRKYYKISDVFEKAVKENLAEVELEDDWIGFIRKSFKESKLMPDKLLRRVEEKIDEIKDR